MVTSDLLQQRTKSALRPVAGALARTAEHARQFICGLHGHDALLHFERDRLSLQCTSCGHETPGWSIARERTEQPSAPQTRVRRARRNAKREVLLTS